MSATIDDDPRPIRLLDLGCGTGGSLLSATKRFGVRGVGLEINPSKVEIAQSKLLPVQLADIRDVDPTDFPDIDYVTLDNVLEHLPSLDTVEEVVTKACQLANLLVHVRHPSFEDEDYLASLGLKQYWTDWPKGHTAHVRMHEFAAMAARAGVYSTIVQPVLRAVDSNDPTILPAGAPANQTKHDGGGVGAYNEARHGPKPVVAFDRPVYYAFDLFLIVGPGQPAIDYPDNTETSDARPVVGWVERSASSGVARRPHSAQTARRAAVASRWLDELGPDQADHAPFVVRRPSGTKYLIDAGSRRQINTGVIAIALEQVLGPYQDHPDNVVDAWPEGAPVDVLQADTGPPFLIAGGRRMPIRGLPVPFPVEHAMVEEYPTGEQLEIASPPIRTPAT